MALNFFSAPISGMDAQSHALGTVSMNIANVRTTGYKSEDTMFQTLLGTTPAVKSNAGGIYGSRADTHGVGYYDRTNITKQGNVGYTGNIYDVAINRQNSFFTVKDANNDTYYTRAGDFTTLSEGGTTYLTTPQGARVQGFTGNLGGGFSSSLSDITLKYQEKIPSRPSSQVSLTANVPASGVDKSSYGINIIGPNNDGQNMNMLFNKVAGKENAWELNFTLQDGTVNHSPIEVIFGSNGEILSPQNFDINVAWNDGSQNNVNIDISKMTQFAGNSAITSIEQDGRKSGDFMKAYIDDDGVLKASYNNGEIVDYAKLAVVGFSSPENLIPINGTMFYAGNDVGNSYYVIGHDTNDKNVLKAQALEQSNVQLEEEFSKMIIVQRAYSMNNNTFKTADDMLKEVTNILA